MNEIKRLGIFVTYCNNGIIDDYIIYYLSEIRKCLNTLAVVSNAVLTDDSKKKLEKYADYVFERDDKGFDVGGLRSAIVDFVGFDKIQEYNELVLMNDSTFGPFYSFNEVFSEMSKYKDLDFWGLTEREKSDFDGGEAIFPGHIQLYFYVVRKRMLFSKVFEDFWNEIGGKITNFRTAIFNYEFNFTQYFAEKGYKWDVYCHIKGYETTDVRKNLSPYHYSSYELISKLRCPLLKRKLFTSEFVEVKYSSREDLKRTFQYIKDKTEYDVNLIWKFVLQNYNLHEIIDSLKLCYTINSTDNDINKNLQNDVSLIKCSESNSIVDDFFKDIHFVSSNINNLNSIVLILSEMNFDDYPYSVKQSEEYRNYENLIKSEAYFSQVIKLFKENSRLGVLVPPVPLYANASDHILSKWRNNIDAKNIYEELKLHVPFDMNRAPVPAMTALLCKKDVLDEKLLNIITKKSIGSINDILQMIPLYAQEKGYYTAYIQSSDYVSINYCNNNTLLYDFLNKLNVKPNQDVTSILDGISKSSIKEFCDKNEHIFIYGAGQLAERVARIVDQAGRKFDCFVVSSMLDNVEILYEHKVCAIDSISIDINKTGVIIAVGKNHNNKVSEKLKLLGFENQFIF